MIRTIGKAASKLVSRQSAFILRQPAFKQNIVTVQRFNFCSHKTGEEANQEKKEESKEEEHKEEKEESTQEEAKKEEDWENEEEFSQGLILSSELQIFQESALFHSPPTKIRFLLVPGNIRLQQLPDC